jgi:DNA polymerase I
MKLLLLVDGSSYLYRAFHALPDLRNPAGEATGAIYGVINMLRKLHADYRPDYSACVFDAKGKTFRDDLYPEYKAHRPPMPDDLAGQIEPLHAAIRALGWPLLMVEGVEADDVIGTLAERASAAGYRTVISTGDKDMVQLVNERVTLVNTMTNETLDPAAAEAKYGIAPERFLDYLSLIGDSVDNVPGVEKVGPKTAVKWIRQYGSLDAVMAHADDIGGVVGANLRAALAWLPQGRHLLTVRTDVALSVAIEDLVLQPRDVEALALLFDRFGFKTWRRELDAATRPAAAQADDPPGPATVAATPAPVPAPAPPVPGRPVTIVDSDGLDALVRTLEGEPAFAFDALCDGEEGLELRAVGLAFAWGDGHAGYVPLGHRGPDREHGDAAAAERVLSRLAPLLSRADRAKHVHDVKRLMHVCANHGIALRGCEEDVMLASYVLGSHLRHDLPALAERHLGVSATSPEALVGRGVGQIDYAQVAVERAASYAGERAVRVLELVRALSGRLRENAALDAVYRTIELPVTRVLFVMERNGVLLDRDSLARQSAELGTSLADLEQRAYAAADQPFNLNSPKQIQEILFTRQGLPVLKKTPSGLPSTDEDVLQQLALDYPLPKLILAYRGLAKLKSTYTDKLPRMVHADTGRVHTTYAQTVAVTGRLSSLDPNLQNIPIRTPEGRRIREAFVAPPGACIVSADYSQIELRIMAHLSGDASLLAAFERGADIHLATAAEVFGLVPEAVTHEQRRYAKAINFGLIYGMSAFGLAAQLGIERAAAQAYIDRYFARYPGVAAYMQRTREQARSAGYVETVFGRRLWLPEIASGSPGRRQAAERAAINAPMQGTAADLVKLAMLRVQGWLDEERRASKLIMQVHDELVLEVPDAERDAVVGILPSLMSGVGDLRVPLLVEVGVGLNWDEAH